jgi:CRISPR type I-E-associated protein CasB/Cse2
MMTSSQTNVDWERARVRPEMTQFVKGMQKLDRGDKAVLRRNVNRSLAESRQAWAIFYRLLPPTVTWDRELYFLVATLMCSNRYTITGNFGQTMRRLKEKRNRASLDRRMAALLDSELDLIEGRYPGRGELAYRLTELVRLAHTQMVGVDWELLLSDLCFWLDKEKRVQKRWAAAYFQRMNQEEEPGTIQEEGK